MSEITDYQKEILSKAYTNHVQEKREPVTWRVCVKAPLNQRPVEMAGDDGLISGFTQSQWLHFQDLSAMFNSIAGTKGMVERYLKSHFPNKIDWSQTNRLGPEVFFQVGFVYALSHAFFEKSKAEPLMEGWQAQGLDCFLHEELSEGADLYSYEAIEGKHAKHIDTSHLSFIGDNRRISGSIEGVWRGKRKDLITKARSQVNEAFETLESEGLAIRIKGKHLFWEWDGISLTEAGVKLVEEMREAATEEPLREGQPEEIPDDAVLLKCPECIGIYYRVTEKFNPDMECTGDMFALLPEYGPSGQNWQALNLNDSGENIVCPSCGGLYVNPDGFLKEGVLIEVQKAREMGWIG